LILLINLSSRPDQEKARKWPGYVPGYVRRDGRQIGARFVSTPCPRNF